MQQDPSSIVMTHCSSCNQRLRRHGDVGTVRLSCMNHMCRREFTAFIPGGEKKWTSPAGYVQPPKQPAPRAPGHSDHLVLCESSTWEQLKAACPIGTKFRLTSGFTTSNTIVTVTGYTCHAFSGSTRYWFDHGVLFDGATVNNFGRIDTVPPHHRTWQDFKSLFSSAFKRISS